MIAELLAWVFTIVLGVGPSIHHAGAGYPFLAWGSAVFSALFLLGIWYLPTRRIEWIGRTRVHDPLLGREAVLIVIGAAGYIICWVYALRA